jgi:hypothetical protein
MAAIVLAFCLELTKFLTWASVWADYFKGFPGENRRNVDIPTLLMAVTLSAASLYSHWIASSSRAAEASIIKTENAAPATLPITKVAEIKAIKEEGWKKIELERQQTKQLEAAAAATAATAAAQIAAIAAATRADSLNRAEAAANAVANADKARHGFGLILGLEALVLVLAFLGQAFSRKTDAELQGQDQDQAEQPEPAAAAPAQREEEAPILSAPPTPAPAIGFKANPPISVWQPPADADAALRLAFLQVRNRYLAAKAKAEKKGSEASKRTAEKHLEKLDALRQQIEKSI